MKTLDLLLFMGSIYLIIMNAYDHNASAILGWACAAIGMFERIIRQERNKKY